MHQISNARHPDCTTQQEQERQPRQLAIAIENRTKANATEPKRSTETSEEEAQSIPRAPTSLRFHPIKPRACCTCSRTRSM